MLGKRILKIAAWVVGGLAGAFVILAAYIHMRWDAKDPRHAPTLTAPRDSASIARGEYIYKYQAQCWGCHQNPPTDPTGPPNGGWLFDLSDAGPGFGKWYSRNLTPDVETGLGGWTDGEIVQAFREGLNKDRVTLFPIMPADWYNGMSDEDALAIVAYLRSLPPVKNAEPRHEPSFFAKALFTFKAIAPKAPITAPISAPPRGATPEYGRYVASNLAGCAECHTPRNMQDGKFYLDSLFAGSSFAFGDAEGSPLLSYARNITPDVETGIGSWSEEQFRTAMTAGVRPDGQVLAPHMPYAYYKSLTEVDMQAIYAYLKTVPALKRTTPANEYSSAVKGAGGVQRGKLLFAARCQSCHGENGGGAQPTNVKLAEVATSLSDAELREFIAMGQIDLKMPGFGKTLSDAELADVIAFIRSWEKK